MASDEENRERREEEMWETEDGEGEGEERNEEEQREEVRREERVVLGGGGGRDQRQRKKKGRGRRKVPIVIMMNENHRDVTFSKRRSGLFKKASELCTLCGCYIAIIVFSAVRRVYSFGHPDVMSVINRFMGWWNEGPQRADIGQGIRQVRLGSNIGELNKKMEELDGVIVVERKEGKEMEEEDMIRSENASPNRYWWRSAGDELRMNECHHLLRSFDELQNTLVMGQTERSIMNANPNDHALHFDPPSDIFDAGFLSALSTPNNFSSNFEAGSSSGHGAAAQDGSSSAPHAAHDHNFALSALPPPPPPHNYVVRTPDIRLSVTDYGVPNAYLPSRAPFTFNGGGGGGFGGGPAAQPAGHNAMMGSRSQTHNNFGDSYASFNAAAFGTGTDTAAPSPNYAFGHGVGHGIVGSSFAGGRDAGSPHQYGGGGVLPPLPPPPAAAPRRYGGGGGLLGFCGGGNDANDMGQGPTWPPR